uniref:Uncharacterized protein ALNC14_006900 n=1 Tax=Albugo laibachii Nc14 TaxID=890382 RepID=F0W0H5_9STRA|nr:unnamed protein product [Albugo laibachii Nc14]|eukprot:CCA14547.1 unnamed protein product [Albugo laibachii Nc14]
MKMELGFSVSLISFVVCVTSTTADTCTQVDTQQRCEATVLNAILRGCRSDICARGDPASIHSAKRLVFISIGISCHVRPLLRLAKEMRNRGYNVAFATHDTQQESIQRANLTFISAGNFPVPQLEMNSKLKKMTQNPTNLGNILTIFGDLYVAIAKPMYDVLIPQLEHQVPELIVMDIATIGAQFLAEKLQIPHIINSPSILFDLGSVPNYIPAWGTGFTLHMSLWHRWLNILFPRLLSVVLTPPFIEINKIRWQLQLKPFRSQHDIFRGARILLNTAFGLEYPQPTSPLVDLVGVILPMRHEEEYLFSQDAIEIQKWIEEGPGNTLLVNLGSLSFIDSRQAGELIRALTFLNARIKAVWILERHQHVVLPSHIPINIKITSPNSISIFQLLKSSSVRLMISHCGMTSAQEALVYGVPLICIPFLLDQPDVTARVVDSGAGLLVDKSQFNCEIIRQSINLILNNGSFPKEARKVGSLLQRSGGIYRAIEVIENTLESGFQHLEPIDVSAPWHRFIMLDVWTVYVAIFCLLLLLFRCVWKALCVVARESNRFTQAIRIRT